MNPEVREAEALATLEPDFLEVLEEWDREELPFILVNGYIPEAETWDMWAKAFSVDAQAAMNLQADFEAQEEENPFGGCQVCGSQGKVLNVGKLHFGHCEEHQTAWMIGSGLFSGWRFESPEVWEANKALLAKCDFSQE